MDKKRILLINSHVRSSSISNDSMVSRLREEPYPSVGLLYLAANLKKNNYDVFYLDIPALIKRNNLSFQDDIDSFVEKTLLKVYKDFKPDLAGVNCLFTGKFPATIFISSILKKIDNDLHVVLGGIHPTVFHKEILERFDCVDFIIIGEGEESFLQLLGHIFLHKTSLYEIDGISYRDGKRVIANPKTKFIHDLNSLPFPDWKMLCMEDYEIEQEKWQEYWHNPRGYKLRYRWPFLSSRSCPMSCNFCAMRLMQGTKIRFRSVENCLEEIEQLYNEYGINYFSVIDDNFTVDKRRIIELSDRIRKKGLKIYIDTPNGISLKYFDKEVLEALKAMGLLRIFLAVESGSDYMRNEVMKKSLPREKIFEIFELVRNEKDISVRAFFLIGMPQETSLTLQESYDMIKKLYVDDVAIHFATPVPGTRLYEEVIENNLLIASGQDMVYAENFHQATDVPWIKPYNLNVEELIEFRKKVRELINQRYKDLGVEKKFPIHHLLKL